MGRPRGATPASAATRARLYETAMALFAEQGYAQTTLRGIAKAAEVSPGLLYRYFPSKAAVVMQLYDALSVAFAERPLPAGPWRRRVVAALRGSLAVLAPHRALLRALVPVLVGDPEQGLFAEQTAFSRARVQAVFVEAVTGADNAPPARLAEPLGRVLYLAHLGLVLTWLLDRSPEQRATAALLEQAERALGVAAVALRLPRADRVVARLDATLRAAFFADAVADDLAAPEDGPTQPRSSP